MLGQGVDAKLAQIVVDGFNGNVAALLVVGIVLMTMVEVYLSDVETVVGLVEAQIVGANAAIGTVFYVHQVFLYSPEHVALVIVGGAASGDARSRREVRCRLSRRCMMRAERVWRAQPVGFL